MRENIINIVLNKAKKGLSTSIGLVCIGSTIIKKIKVKVNRIV